LAVDATGFFGAQAGKPEFAAAFWLNWASGCERDSSRNIRGQCVWETPESLPEHGLTGFLNVDDAGMDHELAGALLQRIP
jgi:hypothetical protein